MLQIEFGAAQRGPQRNTGGFAKCFLECPVAIELRQPLRLGRLQDVLRLLRAEDLARVLHERALAYSLHIYANRYGRGRDGYRGEAVTMTQAEVQLGGPVRETAIGVRAQHRRIHFAEDGSQGFAGEVAPAQPVAPAPLVGECAVARLFAAIEPAEPAIPPLPEIRRREAGNEELYGCGHALLDPG